MSAQPDLQLRTLRLYGELLCRAKSWAHKLTFTAFEGASAAGLAAASSLVGAASLTVDSDTALVKTHFRDGAFDFVVNTLDEAIRAIKNEIRQGRPIAIALIASPAAILAEAVERGLVADAIVCGPHQIPRDYGSICRRRTASLTDSLMPGPRLHKWLTDRGWHAGEIQAAGVVFGDPIRNAWMQNLPPLQRSARLPQRFVWVTIEEIAAFTPPR